MTHAKAYELYVDRRQVRLMLDEGVAQLQRYVDEGQYAEALVIVESIKWAIEVVQKKKEAS